MVKSIAPGFLARLACGLICFSAFHGLSANEFTIDDSRNFTVTESTEMFLDDEAISQEDFEALSHEGYLVKFDVGDDVSDDFTAGTVLSATATIQLKGPVTSVSPLEVFDQRLIIESDTVFEDLSPSTLGSLNPGDILEISGLPIESGGLRVLRLELKSAGVDEWKLTGVVTGQSATSIFIGTQEVIDTGITPRDCDSGLVTGALVEIKATPDPGFAAGQPLDTVTDIECIDPSLVVDDVSGALIRAVQSGLITALALPGSFFLNEQRVLFDSTTVFIGGDVEDLQVNSFVEVLGELDASNDTLVARAVTFRQSRVRIRAPVSPADIDIGNGLTVLQIPVIINSLTEDEDNIVASGIGADQHIEVRGYLDGGVVVASRVRERGDPEFDDVDVRGPAADLAGDTFTILGVNINTTGSSFRDEAGNSISKAAFFALLTAGAEVAAEDGLYDPGSHTLSNAEIQLEDRTNVSKPAAPAIDIKGGLGGRGIGTISKFTAAAAGSPPPGGTPPPPPAPPPASPASGGGGGGGGSLPAGIVGSLLCLLVIRWFTKRAH